MRTKLREALKTALEKAYTKPHDFKTGFESEMTGGNFTLPCIWLCPLEMADRKGRLEGTKTYAVTLWLHEAESSGADDEVRDDQLDTMEQVLTSALGAMAENEEEVLLLDKVKTQPRADAAAGALSLKATCEIMLRY